MVHDGVVELARHFRTVVRHLNLAVISYENRGREIGCWENLDDLAPLESAMANVTCAETDYSVSQTLSYALSAFSLSCTNRTSAPDALVIFNNPVNEVEVRDFAYTESDASIRLKTLGRLLSLRKVSTHIVSLGGAIGIELLIYLPETLQYLNPPPYLDTYNVKEIVNVVSQTLPVCKCKTK
jgi:hypothetical protein